MCINPLPTELLNERTFDARNQFDDLFSALLHVRSLADQTDKEHLRITQNRISSELQAIAQQHNNALNALPRHKQYSRHIIGTDGDWMGYVLRWESQAHSCIHGHPDFAYYQVIDGQFQMDLYEPVSSEAAEYTDTKSLGRGSVIWQQSERGRYDNLVHRVKSDNKPGFTLHLFSEDPARGQHFKCL